MYDHGRLCFWLEKHVPCCWPVSAVMMHMRVLARCLQLPNSTNSSRRMALVPRIYVTFSCALRLRSSARSPLPG